MTTSDWIQGLILVVTAGAVLATAAATVLNGLMYRSQTDPDIIVFVTTVEEQGPLIYVAVQNNGKALATNIQFRWDPEPPSKASGVAPDGNDPIWPFNDVHPLRVGIRSLGPGDRRLYMWGQWGGLTRALQPHGGRLRVACEYTGGPRMLLGQNRRHRGDFVLEVHSLGETPNRASDQHRATEALVKIADVLGSRRA